MCANFTKSRNVENVKSLRQYANQFGRRHISQVVKEQVLVYLHPLQNCLLQEFKAAQKLKFVKQMIDRFSSKKILFADVTHFHLNRHVNKQICIYWYPSNLNHKHVLTQSYCLCCNVDMRNNGDEDGKAHTNTGYSEGIVAMINNFFT